MRCAAERRRAPGSASTDSRVQNIKMAGGWSKNFDADTDWNLITPPMPGVDNRQVKLSRGKFLGGSSGVNGTLCIRGTERDYDDWDLPGWSGREMFAYMRKSEHFHDKDWFQADKDAHGKDGPLHVAPHDLAPISELVLESMQDQGLALRPDVFTTGESANASGHAPRTVHDGLRSTGADFVQDDYRRENIDILCDTVVDKIDIDPSGRATTVQLVRKDGSRRSIRATKEIVVSGGSYCSPAILMRSGIGPEAELEALKIPCKVDLPGVGKNLLDHLIVFVFYEVVKDGLTNDHLVYHDDAAVASYMLYKEKKTGVLSTFPFGAFAFARLDERLKNEPLWQENMAKAAPGRDAMGLTASQPNIEFFTTELYGGPKQYEDYPIEKKSAFAMITELFSPRSRGTVTLKSADPFENPVVDCNYLADPLDLLVLSEGVRYGNEIITQGAATKDIIKGSWPADLTHHQHTTREAWIPHVKKEATTCYHAAGTCKMGKDGDESAVLDAELRVRGVRGLRVADCSVMPSLHGGHTQMPAYGIGEKAADLIKEAHGMKVKKPVL